MDRSDEDRQYISQGPRFINAAAIGLFVGLNALIYAVSVSALVFFGPFASGATQSSIAMLATSLLATLVLLFRRGNLVVLGTVQIAPVAFFLPFFFDLSAAVGTEIPENEAALLLYVILGSTAFLTGIVMVAAALLDLGRLVRLVPYPVTAGFLASAGALLVASSLRLLLPTQSIFETPHDQWRLGDFTNILLAVLAILLMFVLGRWRRDFGPLVGFFLAVILFYVLASVFGMDETDLRDAHLLQSIAPSTGFRLDYKGVATLDTGYLISALPSIIGATLVSVFGLMFNLNGIELASRTELRSREFFLASGVTNVIAGSLGGSVSYPSAVNTVSALNLGGCVRATAIAVCLVLLLGIFAADKIVPALPLFATAGLMGFIGLGILYAWWLRPSARLSNSDSFVIGLIVLSTLLISMLAAIAIGIIVACIIFAVVYARLPVFHRTDTIVSRRSSVDRSPAQNAFLDAHGGDVHILALQGFLFFGSSEQLVSKVHQLLGTNPKPGKIIFDLKRVNGLDSAAVSALFKLTSIAAGTDTKLVLAEAQGETLSVLKAGGFTGRARGHLEYRDTTDDAIEEAEEDLIRLHASKDFEDSALSTLRGLMTKPELAVRLLDTMELRTLRPGERLIKFGEEDTDVYLIDRGRLAVIAKTSAGTDLRVRSLRAGSFVGEIASYAGLARTADVIAEVETKVYFATAETLAQSVEQDPELASEWHKAVASSLAEKLHRTTLHLRESV